ncbi:MAG: PDDEXK nuclease domain-containing protein [Lachnospiraceae bacterium]
MVNNEKMDIMNDREFTSLYQKSKKLIDNARSNMGQMANTITVITSFWLGRYIVEQEQQGQERAKYGSKIIDSLSAYLTKEYGRGFSRSNVAGMRQFYMVYKDRENEIIQSTIGQFGQRSEIIQSGIGQLDMTYARLPFKLSWTHYQILMRIEDKDERDFYEKEAIRSGWNVSTLKRQYHSSLYERLALSRNKDDVLRLANEGAIPQKPEDILHTPYVLEFAGLEDKASYHESDLESAVIDKMQKFLLELGKGFLYEQRQKRFSFHDKNFYVDLILYNRLLRCYVLIDFKADELTHQDLGQMQMYVNYYDRYERIEGENPTIGILLCKKSDEALVDLTLPEDANIYAKEYELYLPDKKTLQRKLKEWLDEEQDKNNEE